MPKEKLPFTPPNTEPGPPLRDEEDLAEDLNESVPLDETHDQDDNSSGLGPRG